jgi:hypothetical protein
MSRAPSQFSGASKMSAGALLPAGKVASFRMQVSRTTRKIGPGASQRPCASLGFDDRNRLAFSQRLAAVPAVRSRERRGQLEPDNFAFNDSGRTHNTNVRKEAHRHEPGQQRVAGQFEVG